MFTPIKLGLAAAATVAAAVPASIVLVDRMDQSDTTATAAPAVIRAVLPKAGERVDDPAFPAPGPTGAAPGPTGAAADATGAAPGSPGAKAARLSAEEISQRVTAGFDTLARPAVDGGRPALPPAPVALGRPAPDLPPGVSREPPVPAPTETAALADPGKADDAGPAATPLDPATTPVPKPAPRAASAAGGKAEAFRALIEKEAEAQKVPPKLAVAVFEIESDLEPAKKGPDGRIGLTQVTYKIAKALGYKGTEKGLADPETNVKWGMKYLAGAYRRAGGDTCRTTMKFQGGHYVEKELALHRTYCEKVKQQMASAD